MPRRKTHSRSVLMPLATASGLPGQAGWADGAAPIDGMTTVDLGGSPSAGWSSLQMLMLLGGVVVLVAVLVRVNMGVSKDEVGYQKCLA